MADFCGSDFAVRFPERKRAFLSIQKQAQRKRFVMLLRLRLRLLVES
jgi:hypothetical protein